MNENKIITTESGRKIKLSDLKFTFSSYEFQGKTYYAEFDFRREYEGDDGWSKLEDGDEYLDFFYATAYDDEGNLFKISVWFKQIKGQEIDTENLDWYHPDELLIEKR